MTVEQLATYELIEKQQIPEMNSVGYLLRHKKTGARVALLSNDDENKVFNIGFRTPPSDSTGVPHIMEHSVLCGSTDFPVKDPFVELVKGSLNTFLNAMTIWMQCFIRTFIKKRRSSVRKAGTMSWKIRTVR